jgi:regulator of protease activity HflC (stomatin/prohibitin superfamily)
MPIDDMFGGRVRQRSGGERPTGWVERNPILTVILGVVLFILVIVVLLSFWVIVPAGHVGVKDTLGVVDDHVFQPGFHLKNPLTRVVVMPTRTQKYIDYGKSDVATIKALSNEGLEVSMGIAVMYHIEPMMAPNIYKTIGQDYENVVMLQPIHSVPRDVISRYDVKTLYSAQHDPNSPDRARIEQELTGGIRSRLTIDGQSRGIVVEDVFIRDIGLPQSLIDSITNKLKMEQEIAQKKFEVQKQEAEADRMRAEARGIADANNIIAKSLTPEYLRWAWIEALKVRTGDTYYVPVGDDGLPLMKNVELGPSGEAAPYTS